MANDQPDLRFGAVAVLDALGFKGIWARYAPREVIRNLRGFTFGDPMYVDPPFNTDRYSLASSVVTLSDTIVVSAAVTGKPVGLDVRNDLECKVAAVASVCSKAGAICSMVLTTSTPFVYRGAVAVGEFVHDDRFLIGPAIDEAAEQEKRADAGLVWLTASAEQVVYESRQGSSGLFDALERFLVTDYLVPMKDDEGRRTSVVNPLRFNFDHDRFLQRADESLQTPEKRSNARDETRWHSSDMHEGRSCRSCEAEGAHRAGSR